MKGPAIVREAMQKAKDRVNAGKKFNATALFKHFVHQVSKVTSLSWLYPLARCWCRLRVARGWAGAILTTTGGPSSAAAGTATLRTDTSPGQRRYIYNHANTERYAKSSIPYPISSMTPEQTEKHSENILHKAQEFIVFMGTINSIQRKKLLIFISLLPYFSPDNPNI